MGACAHARYGGSRATPLAQEPFSQHARTQEPTLYSSCGEALSRASPLAQEPFSKHSPTRRRQFGHSFIARGQKRFLEQPPLAQEPFSKYSDKEARVCALIYIARQLFLGRALSLKSLSQSTCGQRKALTAGKRFLKRALSPKSLSQSTLGQGCARSRILQGGASSGSPSRTRAFLKERSYKEEPARTFIHIAGKRFLGRTLSHTSLFQSTLGQRGASACIHVLFRGKTFSSNPSRERAFLKASSDKGAGAYVHSYCGEVLSRATPLAQ